MPVSSYKLLRQYWRFVYFRFKYSFPGIPLFLRKVDLISQEYEYAYPILSKKQLLFEKNFSFLFFSIICTLSNAFPLLYFNLILHTLLRESFYTSHSLTSFCHYTQAKSVNILSFMHQIIALKTIIMIVAAQISFILWEQLKTVLL